MYALEAAHAKLAKDLGFHGQLHGYRTCAYTHARTLLVCILSESQAPLVLNTEGATCLLQYKTVAVGRLAPSHFRVLCLLRVGTVGFISDTALIQRIVQIITLLLANVSWQHLEGHYNGGATKGASVLQPLADCSALYSTLPAERCHSDRYAMQVTLV